MDKTTEITFTRTPTPTQGNDGEFETGKTYKVSEASAARWIRRGVAEIAKAKPKAKPKGKGEKVEK